jgi:hypothetical protein
MAHSTSSPMRTCWKVTSQSKQVGASLQKKKKTETEAQLQICELKAAKEREFNGNSLNIVDIHVLFEELDYRYKEMLMKWHFWPKKQSSDDGRIKIM